MKSETHQDLISTIDKIKMKSNERNRESNMKHQTKITSHQSKNKITSLKPPSYLFNVIIWMIILLGQSTKANSVFLESCSSNNIDQVFCHNDQMYVIQDRTLYYGNSCGQMMTNETIRITKKFKNSINTIMKTAFIDDKNTIYFFSERFVLTSSLDNRNIAEHNNISQVILDYYGTIKYTVFEPTLKQVYVVDKDDKMYLFNSKIFSHTGSIKWGKEHSRYLYLDLKQYPFDYFFFAGRDLYAKLKGGRNHYSYIRNFGECLKDWKVNDIPDFEHCFNSYFISARAIPFRVLVCTEIQYFLFMIFLALMLLILLFCCLSCCYNYLANKENGGESYYVKENEDRYLKKLFKKYPKEKFNAFVKLYQENKVNPVKLDLNSQQANGAIYDVEFAKNGYQTELKLTPDIKHPLEIKYNVSGAPMEIKQKQEPYLQEDPVMLKKSKKDKKQQPQPRNLISHEINYATTIPVNENNNNLIFVDNNSNFERASLILEDYAENRPDIDLKEPGIDNPRYIMDIKPKLYQVYESNLSQEHTIKVNQIMKDSNYQTSTPSHNKAQPFDFNYSNTKVEEEVKAEKSYSFKNLMPNLKSLFSRALPGTNKDPMTKF